MTTRSGYAERSTVRRSTRRDIVPPVPGLATMVASPRVILVANSGTAFGCRHSVCGLESSVPRGAGEVARTGGHDVAACAEAGPDPRGDRACRARRVSRWQPVRADTGGV